MQRHLGNIEHIEEKAHQSSQMWSVILLYMKGAEKNLKKFVRNLYPSYFIHGKVVTHTGKVVYNNMYTRTLLWGTRIGSSGHTDTQIVLKYYTRIVYMWQWPQTVHMYFT